MRQPLPLLPLPSCTLLRSAKTPLRSNAALQLQTPSATTAALQQPTPCATADLQRKLTTMCRSLYMQTTILPIILFVCCPELIDPRPII
jgi:hypothetical protein